MGSGDVPSIVETVITVVTPREGRLMKKPLISLGIPEREAKRFLGPSACEPFYTGTVQHP